MFKKKKGSHLFIAATGGASEKLEKTHNSVVYFIQCNVYTRSLRLVKQAFSSSLYKKKTHRGPWRVV